MVGSITISVVIPCFNEEKGIQKILSSKPAYLDEIIVVDNNSTDKTAKFARKSGAKVIREKKQGYGAAIRTGIRKATNEVIVVLDGDDTYSLHDIKKFVRYLKEKNLDFVSANRFDKRYNNTMPLLNLLGNKILTFVTQIFFAFDIKDSQSGMFCFRRSILPGIRFQCYGMGFSEEIKISVLKKNPKRFAEFPIEYHDMKRLGTKKLHMWKDGMDNLLFLIKIKFFS